MIKIKSKEEIEKIKKASEIVAICLEEVGKLIRPGVTTKFLDSFAESLIRDFGAIPGFKGYQGYPATLCVSINNEVVHGIPSPAREIKPGDIVSIDVGVLKDEYYGDGAKTFAVGEVSPKIKKLLKTTEQALYNGIAQAKPGNKIGDIGFAIQKTVEKEGFSVVRDLVGHGIGRNLHEDPQVPNYGRKNTGAILKEGMTIAIEPMVNVGTFKVNVLSDNWTIVTADGLWSAHFEHTIAILKNGAKILTKLPKKE